MNETKRDNALFESTMRNAQAMERMAMLEKAQGMSEPAREAEAIQRDQAEAGLLTASPGQERALEDRSQRALNSQLAQMRRESGVDATRRGLQLQQSALQKQKAADQTRIAVRRAKMNAQIQREAARKEAKRTFWSGLATVAGAAAGFAIGGPGGAALGAKIGSAGGNALGGR
jgi:hypothetical protein